MLYFLQDPSPNVRAKPKPERQGHVPLDPAHLINGRQQMISTEGDNR